MLITHDMGVIAETADRVAVMYAGRIVEIGPVGDVIHQPQHPYTRGLMGSIPSIVDEREQLAQIDGAMPRLTAIPSGCPFHPRCAYAFDRCRVERPELMSAGDQPGGVLAARERARSARMSAPLLELIDVARYFDVSPPWLNRLIEGKSRQILKAVDGVSLTIAKGETLGLVGESGCGKSTIARLIVGLYRPTRGEIRFAGRRIDFADAELALRRTMQMIFQDPYASLNPRWRVADIVAEPIRAHGIAQTPREVDGAGGRAARAGRPRRRRTAASIRISSPAGSGSASRSPARSRPTPRSSSATSRPPRSMFRSRRRC